MSAAVPTCSACKEDLTVIAVQEGIFCAWPRRFSKCKLYRGPVSETCHSIARTESDALAGFKPGHRLGDWRECQP